MTVVTNNIMTVWHININGWGCSHWYGHPLLGKETTSLFCLANTESQQGQTAFLCLHSRGCLFCLEYLCNTIRTISRQQLAPTPPNTHHSYIVPSTHYPTQGGFQIRIFIFICIPKPGVYLCPSELMQCPRFEMAKESIKSVDLCNKSKDVTSVTRF